MKLPSFSTGPESPSRNRRALQGGSYSIAAEFTSKAPTQKEEIRLTLHLDSEAYPQTELVFYRYDCDSCLAVVDGSSWALVPREAVVDLIEAVNAIVL